LNKVGITDLEESCNYKDLIGYYLWSCNLVKIVCTLVDRVNDSMNKQISTDDYLFHFP